MYTYIFVSLCIVHIDPWSSPRVLYVLGCFRDQPATSIGFWKYSGNAPFHKVWNPCTSYRPPGGCSVIYTVHQQFVPCCPWCMKVSLGSNKNLKANKRPKSNARHGEEHETEGFCRPTSGSRCWDDARKSGTVIVTVIIVGLFLGHLWVIKDSP